MSDTARGLDLLALFEPGNAGIRTNVTFAGVDIGALVAPYTSGVKNSPTGYTVGGTDLADLFQRRGEVPPSGPGPAPPPPPPVPVSVGVTPGSLVVAGHPGDYSVTAAATVHPSGGSGTFVSYSWRRTSGDVGITPRSPFSPSTDFEATLVSGALQATFTCDVQDSMGGQGGSTNITVTMQGYTLQLSIDPPIDSEQVEYGNVNERPDNVVATFNAVTTNGQGAVTYRWSFLENSGGCTFLGNTAAPQVQVNKFGQTFNVSGRIQCVASDGVSSVTATAQFYLSRQRSDSNFQSGGGGPA